MGIWRSFVSRPASVEHSELYYGGPVYIAGYTPTGEDTMYAFLVEPAQERIGTQRRGGRRAHARGVCGLRRSVERHPRRSRRRARSVNYTWFTQHVVPAPWNRGHAVVIGDAAHTCPPTIAQGAAQALEDAVVLTELLLAADTVDDALWDEFHARRLPRAQAVVDASVQLGQWQIDHDQGGRRRRAHLRHLAQDGGAGMRIARWSADGAVAEGFVIGDRVVPFPDSLTVSRRPRAWAGGRARAVRPRA